MNCEWCDHPQSWHIDYYGGWCGWSITVVGDDVPYSVSCWCGGTEETAGPRIVTSRSTTKLVPDGPDPIGGRTMWKYP